MDTRPKHCNICDGVVDQLLRLDGVPPLQNRFFQDAESARNSVTAGVEFLWCESCQHISIRKNKKSEFDQHYDNSQTASPLVVGQYQSIASDIEQEVPSRDAHVIEIGCGRGEFLRVLRDAGYKNLHGFDPSAPVATELVSNTLWDGQVPLNGADLLLARHIIEEIPDPDVFVEALAKALSDNGRIYCEITNASYLIKNGDPFSMYPEYSNLFSVLSLAKLFGRNGIAVDKVTSINHGEWLGIWGGRLRVSRASDAVTVRLSVIRQKLLELPRPLVLWGAAGRGGNILSFLKIGADEIEFVVDLNDAKRGLFIPPYGQNVISLAQLADIKPAVILLANRKYKDEVVKLAPADCLVLAISDLSQS